MQRLVCFLLFLFLLPLVSCSGMTSSIVTQRSSQHESVSPEGPLPGDPNVIAGTLNNGLTYYLKKNSNPEKRAELRLVVNAGSILEDEDQRGLAHLVEHMAFNGTDHFKRQEIVNYLESVGMRFGPEINAFTSYDETVYMLQLPTDNVEALQTGFQILGDWAQCISFDDNEIERERGVVIEEWRLSRGAETRIREKHSQVLFKGSRYAERLPIGGKQFLEKFDHAALRRFYKDWYRPDLMAVVAVGDFNVQDVQKLIEDRFGKIPTRNDVKERPFFPVPAHNGMLYAVATDPETTKSFVSVAYELPPSPLKTEKDYRRRITERMYKNMFNQRLSELAEKESPPFISAYARKSQLTRTRDIYVISASVKDDSLPAGLQALLMESKRIQEHGFTANELEQEKKYLLHSVEEAYRESDTRSSSSFASDYVDSFLSGKPTLTAEYEHSLYNRYVPGITLAEVNAISADWISEKNGIILAASPEKEGGEIVSESQLSTLVSKAVKASVEPYINCANCGPLVKSLPKKSPVVKEKSLPDVGILEWTLGNGVHVVLKPTDFKTDEILFTAFSPGGTSLITQENVIAAETAADIVSECGVGKFNRSQLQKYLSDKSVSVSPYIDDLTEGLTGEASRGDMESLFQLIYLYLTSPRKDPGAYDAFKTRVQSMCQGRSANPEAVFRDTITAAVTQNNPRFQPWTVETLKHMDLDKSIEIYRDRFADAGDFTFLFVGSFTPEAIKPLVETYLGGLPSLGRQEKWQDVTYDCPTGVVEKSLKKGIEPKSLDSVVFTGPFDWNPRNRYVLNALLDVLRIKLRERIREELGGTYGVTVKSSLDQYPRGRYEIDISFGCDPTRVDELSAAVFQEIEGLKQANNLGDEYLHKVKEIHLRQYETDIKDNDYWLDVLRSRYFNGEDPLNILKFKSLVESLTAEDIREAARQYLKGDNYVKVVLYPE